jgi:hypothetical protein
MLLASLVSLNRALIAGVGAPAAQRFSLGSLNRAAQRFSLVSLNRALIAGVGAPARCPSDLCCCELNLYAAN